MSDPLLLIPGLQSDASSWMPLLDKMRPVHPICIPSGHQYENSVSAMANTVLMQSPGRFHLVGWSMGGYIALEILRFAPERVSSLVLISTTAAPETAAARPARVRSLELARREGMRAYQETNLSNCLHTVGSVDASRMDHIIGASEALGLEAFESQIAAITTRPDSRISIANSSTPLLIIAGLEDRVIPIEEAREIHRLRRNATLHEIPECGHCPPLEQPDVVAGILSTWIDNRTAAIAATAES